MPFRTLVTGGAGFIGSHVATELLDMGHQVYILDDLSGGFRENVPADAELIVGSITDTELVRALFDRLKFDYVFHLAAYAAEGLSHHIRHFNYTNNLLGSINLINAALRHGCRRFVYTSSIAVYGDQPAPFLETTPCRPMDPYGVAKQAVEQDLRIAAQTHGLQTTIFRPHNVFGERQNIADRYRNVVGIFLNQGMSGEPLTIFGDGEQQRAFTHITGVAPSIARCIKAPATVGKTYNIGGDEVLSVNQLAALVAAVLGIRPRITYLPARPEAQIATADHAALQRDMFVPAHLTIAQGLAQMAVWAQQRGRQEPSRFWNIEVPQHLPASWQHP